MKAIVCHNYGPPNSLRLEDVPKPNPAANEVLVKVVATTINDWDWSLVRGKPLVYRTFYGLTKPKKSIFGVELAGVIEEIGDEVTNLAKGDKVYGDVSLSGWGTWAEYVCVPENTLVHIPSGMGYIDASALPHASILAWQGLVEIGKLQKGWKILINGAGGGVGTIGLQIAKAWDVNVTGVDSLQKFPMMEKLGFDQLIDYRKVDFTKKGEKYDLILDTKTTRFPLAYFRALKPEGKYVTVGGDPIRLLQMVSLKPLLSLISSKKLKFVALKPNEGLEHIGKLFTEGKIKPMIDGPYSLEEIPKLLEYFGEARHKGKIVINV